MNRLTFPFIISLLTITACVAEDVCERADITVAGTIITPSPSSPVTDKLKLEGTIDDAEVAIARVWAADIGGSQIALGKAKAGAFNFDQWELEIPAGALQPQPGATTATIDVFVTDICEGGRATDHLLGSFTAPANPPDDTVVSDLQAELLYPADNQCYVPMNGGAEVTLRLRADQVSVGGLVKVSATLVGFEEGKLSDDNKVRLVTYADKAGADIGVFAKDAKAGVATIRASGPGSDTQIVELVVAEPPGLIAGTEAIPAGGQATVLASSRGVLDSCIAVTASTAVTVTVVDSSQNLVAGPVAVGDKDCSDPQAIDSALLQVSFTNEATSDTLVTVRCTDTHGQISNELKFGFMPPPMP